MIRKDCTVDKELSGQLQVAAKSFTSRWRPVMIGVFQGFILGLLVFNTFFNDIDIEIQCTLDRFATALN